MNALLDYRRELGQSFGIADLVHHNPIVGAPRKGVRRFWTGREEKILREVYTAGGVPAALTALPGRSASAIYNRANQMKIPAPTTARRDTPRERWPLDAHIDAAIRRVYQSAPLIGAIKRLAQVVGRPRAWVSNRARQLGLQQPRFKEPVWSAQELQLVGDNATLSLGHLRSKLRRAGFNRTETAIKVKLKRLGADRDDENRFSASALAELFGVDPGSIIQWIEKGWLRAQKIDGDKTLGGGRNWSVHRRDIRRFVIENVAAIDLRKVEKHWFVDLLASREAA